MLAPASGAPDTSRYVFSLIGVMFLIIISGFVGVGALSPGLGAKFLNAEAPEELKKQRKIMGYSAASAAMKRAAIYHVAKRGGKALVSRRVSSAKDLFSGPADTLYSR